MGLESNNEMGLVSRNSPHGFRHKSDVNCEDVVTLAYSGK